MHKGASVLTALVFCIGAAVSSAAQPAEAPEERYLLTVNVVGSGRVLGGDLNCTGQCLRRYAPGEEVVLTAVPADEWTFVGWEPDCGRDRTCTVLMGGDRNVTAIFTYP